ncbi:hypothetical protein KW5_0114910, partial [Xanthomonas vasicola pv. vasculorum NCPPB 1326]
MKNKTLISSTVMVAVLALGPGLAGAQALGGAGGLTGAVGGTVGGVGGATLGGNVGGAGTLDAGSTLEHGQRAIDAQSRHVRGAA